MNKVKEFCNEIWNEKARKQLEAELNYVLKEKIELPKGKNYLKIYAETHKTDEEIMEEQLEEKDKEIERLNNIINEQKENIRKALGKMCSEMVLIDGRGYYYTDISALEDILELKEGK